MIAAIFSESASVDITILGIILGMFGSILGMLASQKRSRREEIKGVISEVISASPEKTVVSPQPFLVKTSKEFVSQPTHDALVRRVEEIEKRQRADKEELLGEIAAVPARTVDLLVKTKGLL